MNTSRLVRLAILLLTILTLSGCILVPVDDGYHRGGSYERDRREHEGERYERR